MMVNLVCDPLAVQNVALDIHMSIQTKILLCRFGCSLGLVARGTERVLAGDRYLIGTGRQKVVPVRVVIRRIASDDSFLILATCKLDPTETSTLYHKRWEVKMLFAVLKPGATTGPSGAPCDQTRPHAAALEPTGTDLRLDASRRREAHAVGGSPAEKGAPALSEDPVPVRIGLVATH